MARVDMQITRALSRLKDKGEHDFQRDEILAEMNQVQVDLCKDYFALKFDSTISLVSGTDEYTLAATIWRVKESIEPTTWRHRIRWTHDSTIWAEVTRRVSMTGTPRFGFTWNRKIRLHPTPTTTESLTIIGYGLPAADLAFGGTPEIPQEWDEALMLGAVKNLIGGDFERQYKGEADKVMTQSIKESVNGVQRIDYSGMDRWSNKHHESSNWYNDGTAWWD
jgi:hypothetical protein